MAKVVGIVKRFIFLLALIMMGGIILFGCSSKNEVTTKEKPEETVEEEQEEKESFAHVFPLTGIETNEEIDHRPIAVMINNAPEARPQSGLNEADLVYEVLAEGGNITRFVAIFHSEQPKNIGPVRSARGYHIDLSNGYDALFVAHGWSPEAQVMLQQEKKADYLQGLFHDGTYFKRSKDRVAPHNSYITYENAREGLAASGYELEREIEPLSFYTDEEIAELTGTKAESVSIQYSNYNVSYYYDPEEKVYFRSSAGTQTVDYDTGEPLKVNNVFVVEMNHQVVDNEGRLKIDLTSGGDGILLQNGLVHEVHWENIDGRILPVIDGEVVKFVPGKTWINIVQKMSDVALMEE